jgi:DNA-3-methyladenine glycosylase I
VLDDDAALFERLVLEINQAGLSWLTILKKREAFRRAYDGFDPAVVAATGRGRGDGCSPTPGSSATGSRWRRRSPTPSVSSSCGSRTAPSPRGWRCHPLPKAEWVKLFKQTFRFTGGEIVGEFLMSIGYLPGAHVERCPVYPRVLAKRPPWARLTGAAR